MSNPFFKNKGPYKIENLLIKQAKKMIPKRKFACVFSGGIDSSLQSAIINKIKKQL